MATAQRPGWLYPVVISLGLASVTGLITAHATGTPIDLPISEDTRRSAGAQLASRLPWATSTGSPTELSLAAAPEAYEVALGSTECVVLVVTALDHPLNVSVRAPSLPPEAATTRRCDVTEAYAYCTGPDAEAITFDITAAGPVPSRAHVEELRAPANDEHNLFTLSNGLYPSSFLDARWAQILEEHLRKREREGTGDGEVVAGPILVDAEHGPLVLPFDEVSMHAVDQAAQLGLVEKTQTTYIAQDGQNGRNGPDEPGGETLPTVRWGDARWRILAAVDGRAFEHCVSVEHWPQAMAEDLPGLRVLYLPSGRVDTDAATITTLCPEDGIAIVASDLVDLDYRVVVRRGAEAALHSRTQFDLTETEPFREDLRRCEAGDAEACVATSTRLLTGHGVTADEGRAEQLTARACELSATECWTAAGYHEGPRRVQLLQRACEEGGDHIACGSLGDHNRLGLGTPVDYQGAWAAYRRTCGVSSESCTHAGNLVRVGLATAEAEP